VLAGRVGAFCERYPELSIEFVTSEHIGDLVAEGIDLAIRFGHPRHASLVARKLIEAPILTVAAPRYLERYGKPVHPRELDRHRRLQFLDPYTGRPFQWEFIRGKKSVEVRKARTFAGGCLREGWKAKSGKPNHRPAHVHRSQIDAAGMRRRHRRRPALAVPVREEVDQDALGQQSRFLPRDRHGPLASPTAEPEHQRGASEATHRLDKSTSFDSHPLSANPP
jgi:LysR substrate binding domain